ncbi:MAG: alpha-amylase family glycosyl hydrolase, partial [Ruminococcus sp.]
MSKKLLSVFMALIMMFCVISTLPVGAEEVENQETNTSSSTAKVGDADKSGEVNIKDATLIQKALVDSSLSLDSSLCDVYDDGEINVRDVTAIQKYLNKTIRNFPKTVDNDWRTSSIGYEIFVRSFYDSDGDGCGDFNGIAEKVDYLKSLNVGVVWLTPINPSDSYHGYDVTDYKAVNQDFGTMDDFNNMLDTLHENGIKVILDLVVNHTSNKHQWFQNARYNKGDYRDFYVWS